MNMKIYFILFISEIFNSLKTFATPGGASPYVPPVPGHRQFSDQISVKTYVGTGSFYCEMCPRKLGHAQFEKRDSPPE